MNYLKMNKGGRGRRGDEEGKRRKMLNRGKGHVETHHCASP